MTMASKIIINIGRQFGAGGRAVAQILSDRLGIRAYDQELITEAARESGFSRELFVQSDEKKRSLTLSSLFGFTRWHMNSGSGINDSDLFRIQSDVIRSIADQGSAIFIGRAADFVLREMDCCIDVFLTSPTEVRCQRVSQREEISPAAASQLIQRRDAERRDYYNYLTFGDWGAASNYDLCLDTSVLGFEGTAAIILDFARRKGLLDDDATLR